MTHELFYTSAPRGLQPGSRGFCTVAMTHGLPKPLLERVEALSGYRPLFPPHDPNAGLNPVAWSHVRVTVGGRTSSVLSRVCAAGLDYSERTNKFAHHVILDPGDQPPAGPAWLLRQPGFLETQWDGEVRQLPAGRTPPHGQAVLAVCRAWQERTGDAGWAGVVAEALESPGRNVYLLFEPGMDLLPLLDEALRLLPPEQRWQVTFNTFATSLPQGVQCQVRGLPRDSAEAKNAQRLPGVLIVDLGAPLGAATGGPLVDAARSGRVAIAPMREPEPMPANNPAGRWAAPVAPAKAPDHVMVIPVAAARQPVHAMAPMTPREPSRSGPWLANFFIGTAAGILGLFIIGATAWGMGFVHFGSQAGTSQAVIPSAPGDPLPSGPGEEIAAREKKLQARLFEVEREEKKLNADRQTLDLRMGDLDKRDQLIKGLQADLDRSKGDLEGRQKKFDVDRLALDQRKGDLDKLEQEIRSKAEIRAPKKANEVDEYADLPEALKDSPNYHLVNLDRYFAAMKDPKNFSLRVRGFGDKESVKLNSNPNFALKVERSLSTLNVILKDVPKEKSETLAQFRIGDGKLILNWSHLKQKDGPVREAWNLLRNAVLEVEGQGKVCSVALRTRTEFSFAEKKTLNLTVQGLVNAAVNQWKEGESIQYPLHVSCFEIEMEKGSGETPKMTRLAFVVSVFIEKYRVELVRITIL